MSKLLKYLKKYKIESILAPFFKLIEVAFELTVPLIVSTIIDVGIENGDKVYIIKRCLLLGLLGILGSLQYACGAVFLGESVSRLRYRYPPRALPAYRQALLFPARFARAPSL